MIEVNKNTLAGAFGALGKLICRTSPLALYKSIKIEAEDRTLRLSTCGLNEGVTFELEADGDDAVGGPDGNGDPITGLICNIMYMNEKGDMIEAAVFEQ